jgi:hypothetical protein
MQDKGLFHGVPETGVLFQEKSFRMQEPSAISSERIGGFVYLRLSEKNFV